MLLLGIAFSVFMTVHGTVLVFNGKLYLRFHDAVVDRTEWGRNARWRQHVNGPSAKFAGVVFVVFGLFFCFQTVSALMSML